MCCSGNVVYREEAAPFTSFSLRRIISLDQFMLLCGFVRSHSLWVASQRINKDLAFCLYTTNQTWHALICVEYSNWICLLKIGKETGLHPCGPQTV